MLHMLHAPLVVNIMLRVAKKTKYILKLVYHNRIEKISLKLIEKIFFESAFSR